MTTISPLSFVHPDAKLGKGIEILPFSYVEADVVIGDGCRIGPSANILSGTRLGVNCHIFPGAVLGALPQDLKFAGEYSTLTVGNHTVVRESATVNRGTAVTGNTAIGARCLLMAYVHVAHDCILGNEVVLSNQVQLAGHVQIGDYATLGGNVLVQQFCRIGRFSFIGGAGLVRKHVPPFVRAAREPLSFLGINRIGLKRKGFSEEDLALIQEIYRLLYGRTLLRQEALLTIRESYPDSELATEILNFTESDPNLIGAPRMGQLKFWGEDTCA